MSLATKVGQRGYARAAIKSGSRLKYQDSANVYAELVDEGQIEPNVRIMSMENVDQEHNYASHAPQNDPSYYSSRSERMHVDTLAGKSYGARTLELPQVYSDIITNATKNYTPTRLRQSASRYYKSLAEQEAHRPATETLDVETHLTGIFLQNFASLHNVISEVIRRKGSDWNPKRVLDVGFGPATGMIVLNELMPETWTPERKVAVVIGHSNMKKYASAMLSNREPAFKDVVEEEVVEETEGTQEVIEELEEEIEEIVEDEIEEKDGQGQRTVLRSHLPPYGSPSKYDLIIATHQLYRSGFHYPASVDDHTTHLISLLAPGGVLVLVERGDPTGFETIARARQIVLRPENSRDNVSRTYKEFKDSEIRVIAPCSHHGKCPLQVGLEKRNAGKDPAFFNWCKFGQVIQRPPFVSELKRGKILAQKWTVQTEDGSFRGQGGRALSGGGRPFGRNTETATHSYIVFEKKPQDESQVTQVPDWPRVMRSPMKRDKHVIMEVCAPSAQIEQWTVTPSFNKAAYHDARKAAGGDLWALGAKTVQNRGGNRTKFTRFVDSTKQKDTRTTTTTEDDSSVVDQAWEGKGPRKPIQQQEEDTGVFSDAYFKDLASVFDSKRYRDDEKRWSKARYFEKRSRDKW